MKSLVFRKCKESDLRKVLEIYNFHIENNLGNFEENINTYKEFKKKYLNIINLKLPFIVCEQNLCLIGFAYLTPFRDRSGYRYTFENSIYMNSNYIGMGIGSKLLKNLVSLSKKNKQIKNIIAVIGNKKNKNSIEVHKKNGFKICGILKRVGFKKNKWLDSIYMQNILYEKNK
jgi:phosphinothricin acetyltransferase|tara:strand:+ start:122 stop:640 length:519 start_codon:yes stop_codon:yes gene_type:complete